MQRGSYPGRQKVGKEKEGVCASAETDFLGTSVSPSVSEKLG